MKISLSSPSPNVNKEALHFLPEGLKMEVEKVLEGIGHYKLWFER